MRTLIVVLALLSPSLAHAQQTEVVITNGGGGLACATRADLDRAHAAAQRGDDNTLQALLVLDRCLIMPVGLRGFVDDYGWLVSSVYLRAGTIGDVLVWTATDNFDVPH